MTNPTLQAPVQWRAICTLMDARASMLSSMTSERRRALGLFTSRFYLYIKDEGNLLRRLISLILPFSFTDSFIM